MPILLQIILPLIGGIAALISICYLIIRAQVIVETRKVERHLEEKIERRMEKIEENFATSIKPLFAILYRQNLNPLTHEENERKNYLLHTLEQRKLAIQEAKELQILLQKELDEAQKKTDTATVVAIIAVLLLLAFILSKE